MHIRIHQQYHKDFTKAGYHVQATFFKEKGLEMICTGPLSLEGATIYFIKLTLPSSKARRKNSSLRRIGPGLIRLEIPLLFPFGFSRIYSLFAIPKVLYFES